MEDRIILNVKKDKRCPSNVLVFNINHVILSTNFYTFYMGFFTNKKACLYINYTCVFYMKCTQLQFSFYLWEFGGCNNY